MGRFRGGGDDDKKKDSAKDNKDSDSGGGMLGGVMSRFRGGGDDDKKKDSAKSDQSKGKAKPGSSSGGVMGRFRGGGKKDDKASSSSASSTGPARKQSAFGAAKSKGGDSKSKGKSDDGVGFMQKMRERLPFGHRAKDARKSKTSKTRSSKVPKRAEDEGLSLDDKLDFLGVGLVFGALVIFFSSLSGQQGSLTGAINTFFGQLLGVGAFGVPLIMAGIGIWLIVRHFGEEAPEIDPIRITGMAMAYIGLLMIFMIIETFTNPFYGMATPETFNIVLERTTIPNMHGGGRVGAFLYSLAVTNLGEFPAFFLVAGWMVVSLMAITRTSAAEMAIFVISLWRSFRQSLQRRAQRRRAERLALAERQAQLQAEQVQVSRPEPASLPAAQATALPESAAGVPIEERGIPIRIGGQLERVDSGAQPAPPPPAGLPNQPAAATTAPPASKEKDSGGSLFGNLGRVLPFGGNGKSDDSSEEPAASTVTKTPPAEKDKDSSGNSGLFGNLGRVLPFGGNGKPETAAEEKPATAATPPGPAKSDETATKPPAELSPEEEDALEDENDEQRFTPGIARPSPFDKIASTQAPRDPEPALPSNPAQSTTKTEASESSRFARPKTDSSPSSSPSPFTRPAAARPSPFGPKEEQVEDLADSDAEDIETIAEPAASSTAGSRFGVKSFSGKSEDQVEARQQRLDAIRSGERSTQPPAEAETPKQTERDAGPFRKPAANADGTPAHDKAFTPPSSAAGRPATPDPENLVPAPRPPQHERVQPKQDDWQAPAINPDEHKADVAQPKVPTSPKKQWRLPDHRTLLSSGSEGEFDRDLLVQRARTIEETLSAFGAPGKVVEINTGPVITQFGVEPDYLTGRGGKKSRVKVNAISQLDKDLQLALGAKTIRIEAPVPGKGFVGIEVPNEEASLVGLRDVMESKQFQKIGEKSPLAIALGQSVDGAPVAADLSAMPHILIAGTTGSGKSVCVNSIIASLLIRNTPDMVKFIMVDPKRVELTGYNGIPHLVAPVVVELERIVGVLKWVTREMDERYKKFSEAGARNIEDYNAHRDPGTPNMPYIVVIVDELADLMMLAPDETERTITRIAALARATGIHLVIATQRPSVDVVTGLIKANFPARIAFAVAGGVDSRVILDQPGAERLLGKGDMLYLSPDAPAPLRLQGVFVSDMEISNINRFWKTQGPDTGPQKPITSLIGDDSPSGDRRSVIPKGERFTMTPPSSTSSEDGGQRAFWEETSPSNPDNHSAGYGSTSVDEKAHEDELYEEAVDLVRRLNKASVSLLQRRLRIGYTRAARLIDVMEAEGIVGPPVEGSKPREVLPEKK